MAFDLISLVARLTLEDEGYTEALNAAVETAQAFERGFGDSTESVSDNVASMSDEFLNFYDELYDAIAQTDITDDLLGISEAVDAVGSSAEGVDGALTAVGDAMDAMAGAASGASGDIDGVADAAMGAADSMADIGGGAWDAAGGMDTAEGSAGGLASTLGSTLVSGASAALSEIVAMSIGAVDAFGKIAGAITDVVGGLAEYGDTIDKESQKLGISAQAYQEWDAVLQHSGTSIDVLKRGMMTMSTAMDELSAASKRVVDPEAVDKARNAYKDAVADLDAAKIEVAEAQKKYGISSKEAEKASLKMSKAFRKAEEAEKNYKKELQGTTPEVGKAASAITALGISMTDSEGKAKSQEEVFRETITALQGIEDPARRAAVAQDIFGRGAAELAPLLNTTAEETQGMIDRFHELGGALSDETVKNSAAFQDAMQDLKTAADGVKNQFIAIIMPTVTTAIENITQLIVDVKPIINDVAGAISAAWNGVVAPVLDALWSLVSMVVGAVVDLWQGTFVPAIQTAWGAVQTFWESTLKPAFEQLRDFVINEVVPVVIEKWNEVKARVAEAWQTIADYWNEILKPALQELWDFVVQEVVPVVVAKWNEFREKVSEAWQTIVDYWNEILKPALQELWDFVVQEIVPAVVDAWQNVLQPAIEAVFTAIADFWNNTLKPAWEAMQSFVIDTLVPAIQAAWEGLQPVIETVFGAIASAWTGTLRPAFNGIKSALEEVGKAFTRVWDGAKTTVQKAINAIKGFLDFKWELPKLKLPHIKITGKFSLMPPEAPKFSVEWYKKAMLNGMIINTPTILPGTDGSMRGFGDAGPEAVVGVSSLRQMIQDAVRGATAGPAQQIVVPRTDTRPIEITVKLADDTVLARAIHRMNESEAQRLGSKLVTGVI